MSADDMRIRYAKALEPTQPFTHHLVDAMMAARDEEMERLRAELNAQIAENRELDEELQRCGGRMVDAEAELKRIPAAIEAEREKTRDAEGATLRDENVLNGIVNGLGIALRIVRGEQP